MAVFSLIKAGPGFLERLPRVTWYRILKWALAGIGLDFALDQVWPTASGLTDTSPHFCAREALK